MRRYSVKVPLSAILDKPGGEQVSVTLPAGAVLQESTRPSTTLLGMVGVYWEGRHYSVSLGDLLKKAELVSTA
jgi:hypothetical protein